MPAQDHSRISMDDVLDYTSAVESMYGIEVVLRITPSKDTKRPAWQLKAVAYDHRSEKPYVPVAEQLVLYPSVDYKSFPGAALNVVMKMEQLLQAWYWLKNMNHTP